MPFAPYRDLAELLTARLTAAYLGRDRPFDHDADVVMSFFSDELLAREFTREVEAVADAIVGYLRQSGEEERVRGHVEHREIARELMTFIGSTSATDMVPIPEVSEARTPLGRLKIEAAHLVNDLIGFPPQLDPEHPAESLDHLKRMLAAAAESSALIHQIQSQTSGLVNSRAASASHLGQEAEFRIRLAKEVDRVDLFGADIDPVAQRSLLTETFIPLSVTTPSGAQHALRPFDAVLSHIVKTSGRLIIRGPAGSGKTTLMRWTALRCVEHDRKAYYRALQKRSDAVADAHDSGDEISHDRWQELTDKIGEWRQRIPFLIYLRHCEQGRLPGPDGVARLISSGPGSPDGDWVEEILQAGRGLILIDGIDEVPLMRRDSMRDSLDAITARYPDNLFVVTTRPEAVPPGWLGDQGFIDADVAPMSIHDTVRLIDLWHQAMAHDLVRFNKRHDDLESLGSRLIEKVRNESALALLAANPLLCAMLCALHHYRRGTTPRSMGKLVEALCEMLLHRRERESGLSSEHVDAIWASLEYEPKRSVVQRLAHEMIVNETSSLSTTRAVEIVREELSQIPDHSPSDAETVLQALLERSGMLREARPATEEDDGLIDFLHNTFKEYLAAELFVMESAVAFLIDRCANDPGWRRVALFAVSVPSASFASEFISAFLDLTRESAEPTPDEAGLRRERELFCLQCRAASWRLEEDLNSELDVLLTEIFPPRRAQDGELIATIGEIAVPFLRPRANSTEEQAAGCVRALRLINTAQARALLEEYRKEERPAVMLEVAHWINPLTIPAVQKVVSAGENVPDWLSGQLRDLRPLASIEDLTTLNLADSGIDSLATLPELPHLTELDISRTSVSSLQNLPRLPSLRRLIAESTEITELIGLEPLTNLNTLNISMTSVRDLSPLRDCIGLRELNVNWTEVSNLAPLKELTSLEVLNAQGTRVRDCGKLSKMQGLRVLELAESSLQDLSGIETCDSLERVDLRRTNVRDLSPLAGLGRLEWIDLRGTRVEDVSHLESAKRLKELFFVYSSETQLRPLASLVNLFVNRLPHEEWARPFLRDVVFVSYAHEQQQVLAELKEMLIPALKGRVVESMWSDQEIEPGSEWRDEIWRNMAQTRVAVLLVTREFLASKFISTVELPYFLKSARRHLVTLIWIPVNHAFYEETELAEFHAAIDPQRPLESFRGAKREETLKRIAKVIVKEYDTKEIKQISHARPTSEW